METHEIHEHCFWGYSLTLRQRRASALRGGAVFFGFVRIGGSDLVYLSVGFALATLEGPGEIG